MDATEQQRHGRRDPASGGDVGADPDVDLAPDLAAAEALRAAVGNFVRRVRALDAIPSGQLAVLGHLVRDGDQTVAELATAQRVRHQSMARTVGLLSDQRLVESAADLHDRRKVRVRASDEGRRLLLEHRRHRAQVIASATARSLDPQQRRRAAEIAGLLDAISAAVDAAP